MGRDRVALFAAVREDHRLGLGVRAIARNYGVHRRVVREALSRPCWTDPKPSPRRPWNPSRSTSPRPAITRYGRIDLLCLDELGYIELDRRGAELLFQVFTEREEKSSITVASNAAFSQ